MAASTVGKSAAVGVSGALPPLYPATNRPSSFTPTGWDLGIFGTSDRLPGKSRITKCVLGTKHDPKERAGKHGGKPTTHGLKASTVELECTVWTDPDLALLVAIRDKYYPPKITRKSAPAATTTLASPTVNTTAPGNLVELAPTPATPATPASPAKAAPLSVADQMANDGAIAFDHPAVRGLRMSAVVIIEVSGILDASEPKGGKRITFTLLQWLPNDSLFNANAKNTPKRAIINDAARQAGLTNPLPSQQAGAGVLAL